MASRSWLPDDRWSHVRAYFFYPKNPALTTPPPPLLTSHLTQTGRPPERPASCLLVAMSRRDEGLDRKGRPVRYFIGLQKTNGLWLDDGTCDNESLAHELNHELMGMGYVLSHHAFRAVASQDEATLTAIHRDLIEGIHRVTGGESEYEPIYRNFPQSVMARSYEEFVINALIHYWSEGTWRPEDLGHVQREVAIEPVSLKPISLITRPRFERIFTDLIYGRTSISAFDKMCIDWFLDEGASYDPANVVFDEVAAYLFRRLLDDKETQVLPIKRATTVLRTWAAYSGGDEGLKEDTVFLNPTNRQRRVLARTLEACAAEDVEESFKQYREIWLRVLHYMHPMSPKMARRFPQVAWLADALRNRPGTLKTFNGRVEEMIEHKDPQIFSLLSKRPGVFMRRLDHLVREFGVEAAQAWFALKPRFDQLVAIYNHFATRAETSQGRGAVLAGQDQSEFVTYDALDPLPRSVVEAITGEALSQLRGHSVPELEAGPVYIDPMLYYAPLATNQRASQLSLDSKAIGTTEVYDGEGTLRIYVHWHGTSDIDLSGFAITHNAQVLKVGWNASHHSGYLVYSGDNTGYAEQNAEYLDIDTRTIPEEIAWIVVEARIFRGPNSFAGYEGKVHAGWMHRTKPEANKHWLPQTLSHARDTAKRRQERVLDGVSPRHQEHRVSGHVDGRRARLVCHGCPQDATLSGDVRHAARR